jgi:antitoxin FitA
LRLRFSRGASGIFDTLVDDPYVGGVASMILLRKVPKALHRRLKACAAKEGLSLSEFLIREVSKIVERPSAAEMYRILASRTRVNPSISAAEIIREMRDGK